MLLGDNWPASWPSSYCISSSTWSRLDSRVSTLASSLSMPAAISCVDILSSLFSTYSDFISSAPSLTFLSSSAYKLYNTLVCLRKVKLLSLSRVFISYVWSFICSLTTSSKFCTYSVTNGLGFVIPSEFDYASTILIKLI